MKIAQVGPLWENIPPEQYGGTERIVSALTEGLVQKGHDVTLFACGTSKTSAKLVSVYPRPLFRDGIPWTDIMYPLLNITEAFDKENEFDVIHVHLNKSSDYLSLPLTVPIKNKVFFTLHFVYPSLQNKNGHHAVLQKYKDLQYVSISNAQRKGGENLNWVKTVYNGIELSQYSYSDKPKDHLLWLGKINPDKGTKEAILAAKKSGKKLIVAGTVDKLDSRDHDYYVKEIEPLIDNKQIIFMGELNNEQKNRIYGEAYAFINPIVWNEPFGLVMAEAMATGTPVIGFNNGAAPEIIKDSETGYLVNENDSFKGNWQIQKTGIDGICEGIEKIYALPADKYLEMRQAARQRIMNHFTTKQMVDGYEQVYLRTKLDN